jgi:hypothetical protein
MKLKFFPLITWNGGIDQANYCSTYPIIYTAAPEIANIRKLKNKAVRTGSRT